MAICVTMPALSPTMEAGTLASWHVKPGDKVEPGDILAEIETDKATMEVEAVDEGTVAKLLVEAGTEGVKVNAVIALLTEEGEDPGAVEAGGAGSAPSRPDDLQADRARDAGPGTAPRNGQAGQGPDGPGRPAGVGAGDTRIKASPLARRIAALEGIDLSALSGSGPHGRIVRRDVEAAAAKGPAAGSPPASTSRELVPVAPGDLIRPQGLDPRVYAPGSYTLEPLDGMRRTVARRLTESFMQVPHFPLTVDLRIDALLAFRTRINAAAPEGTRVSVNDMLIKSAALALVETPECNASYTDEGIAYHRSAHVSVAVAVDGGLITPVVRDAQDKGLAAIAREMADLAGRARARKLKPDEYMGGTFSLSNLGMFGIRDFGSILNPPEGMILSVGAGERRPVVLEDDTLGIATVMTVTLTCDHRVIGGAEGARWLAAFRRYVETPEAMVL